MEIVATEIPAVKIIVAKKHGDARGFFSEIYSRKLFHDAGIDAVEVFHPDVPDDDRERFSNIAKFRGRFVTESTEPAKMSSNGSYCHG